MGFPVSPSPAVTTCRVRFGAAATRMAATRPPALDLELPVLGGHPEECVLNHAEPTAPREGFTLFRAGQHLAGFAIAPAPAALEAATIELYRGLFTVTASLHLLRIWNYIPEINAAPDGLENYRHFCRGRSLAFERHFGDDFHRRLPAASGVGTPRGPLALAFVAGPEAPQHFENPEQVPAFRYPEDYGPRPPSFSRATLARDPSGQPQLFISGTAAIRGHATQAAGDLVRQNACTIENLQRISVAAGVGRDLGSAGGWQRAFKVYIRHARDADAVRAHLERSLFIPGDSVSYLHSDLCRTDLLVEIEAVLTKRT